MTKNRLLDLKNLKFELRDIMRYDDVGDYFGNTIVAYDFKDDIVNNAIFLHEFIEYTLVKSAGIDPAMIDQFDTDDSAKEKFPKEFALYTKFHEMANVIEKQFVENLGISWSEHDKKIYSANVQVAQSEVQKISDELHKKDPSEEEIQKSKKIIKEQMEE